MPRSRRLAVVVGRENSSRAHSRVYSCWGFVTEAEQVNLRAKVSLMAKADAETEAKSLIKAAKRAQRIIDNCRVYRDALGRMRREHRAADGTYRQMPEAEFRSLVLDVRRVHDRFGLLVDEVTVAMFKTSDLWSDDMVGNTQSLEG